MNKNNKSLDEYFDQARSIPPFISKDDARLFLERNINEYTTVIESRPFYQNKNYYITGAAMATIALIILFVTSLFNHSDQQTITTQQNVFQKQTSQLTADSTKEKSNQKSNDSEKKFTSSKQTSKSEIDLDVKQRNVDQNTLNPNVSYASWTPEKIQGIRIFNLDTTELTKLGIVITSDGYIMEYDDVNRTSYWKWKKIKNGAEIVLPVFSKRLPDISFEYSRQTDSLGIKNMIQKNMGDKQLIELPHPVLVTGNYGWKFRYREGYEGYVAPNLHDSAQFKNVLKTPRPSGLSLYSMRELIPIRVNPPNIVSDTGLYNDDFFIYWYEPTKNFIELLPDKIQKIILSDNQNQTEEQHQILVKNQNEIPKQLETTVFPNPISNSTATLKYTLPEQSRVAVSLYNIEGQRLKEFSATEQRDKGKWEEQLSLGDVQAGMYLLAVMTDKGEQSVQRIMVLK